MKIRDRRSTTGVTPARGFARLQVSRSCQRCGISAGEASTLPEASTSGTKDGDRRAAGRLNRRPLAIACARPFDDAMVKEGCLGAGVLPTVVFSGLLNPAQNRVVTAVAPMQPPIACAMVLRAIGLGQLHFPGTSTETKINEWVAWTEQGGPSPPETRGVRQSCSNPEGYQNVQYCSFGLGSPEPALAAVDGVTAGDDAERSCHRQQGQLGARQ